MIAVAARTTAEVRAASKSVACWTFLALGLGNLLSGLALGIGDWTPTFVLLDVVYANFGLAVWAVVIILPGIRPPVVGGIALAAKSVALALVAAAMLTLAGLAAISVQLWHGRATPDALRYLTGLYVGFGWSALHLAMLALAMRAILGRRWPALAATAALWIGSNTGFEHLLLRFGAPVGPLSGMNGPGPYLAPQVAAGIHWTGLCVALLAVGRWLSGRRSAKSGAPSPRPLGPNAFAVAWTAAVAWAVSGGWIYYNVDIVNEYRTRAEGTALAQAVSRRRARFHDLPQPVYSRLDLDVAISPLDRALASRGTAIVVNPLDVPIPDIHFSIPRELTVHTFTLTGDLVEVDEVTGHRRYRLNRPLEPRETLKIGFDLGRIAQGFENDVEARGLLANGTHLSTAELVPAMGYGGVRHPFETAPPIAYRARISTSLDQVGVTEGVLVGEWKENGRRVFEYESEFPIPPLAPIHSGRYAVARDRWQDIEIEVFHHPAHTANVAPTIRDLGSALLRSRGSERYRHSVIRLVEVPDYRPFRSLGLGGFRFGAEAPPDAVPGMVFAYSERGNWFSRPPPTGSTPPRA